MTPDGRLRSHRLLAIALLAANILLLPASPLLIPHPSLAALPAMVFGGLFPVSRRKIVLAAAVAWVLYLPYEYSMKLRLLCSGECNIRVDLLLICPALFALSAAGCVALAKGWRERRLVWG